MCVLLNFTCIFYAAPTVCSTLFLLLLLFNNKNTLETVWFNKVKHSSHENWVNVLDNYRFHKHDYRPMRTPLARNSKIIFGSVVCECARMRQHEHSIWIKRPKLRYSSTHTWTLDIWYYFLFYSRRPCERIFWHPIQPSTRKNGLLYHFFHKFRENYIHRWQTNRQRRTNRNRRRIQRNDDVSERY